MSENDVSSEYNIDQVYADLNKPEAPPQVTPEGLQEIIKPKDKPFLEMKMGDENKVFDKDMVTDLIKKYHENKNKYDEYDNNLNKFNSERSKFDEQRKEFDTTFGEWKKIDDYARANPQWWQHVQDQYEKNTQYNPDEKDNIGSHPMVQNLNAKIDALTQQIHAQNEATRKQRMGEEDSKLDNEVQDYKKTFPDFNWNKKDDMGVSLEDKITQHAVKIKTDSFKTAANDYLFQEHIKMAKTKALAEQAKQIQNNNKLGIGPISDKSQLKPKISGIDPKTMSYNQISKMITDNL